MKLDAMTCPLCRGKLTPMANGGSYWLRCETEPPRCGVMWPALTAMAKHADRVRDDKAKLMAVTNTTAPTGLDSGLAVRSLRADIDARTIE